MSALVSALPGAARAQSVDIQFACPPTLDAADRATASAPQGQTLSVPGGFQCAIFYGYSGAQAAGLTFEVEFPQRTDDVVTDGLTWPGTAVLVPQTEKLPGHWKWPTFTPNNTATSYTSRLLDTVSAVSGFAAPTWDYGTQKATWSLTVQPAQTTSLQFGTTENYHIVDYNPQYPACAYATDPSCAIVLTAKLDGVPVMNGGALARWIVPLKVNQTATGVARLPELQAEPATSTGAPLRVPTSSHLTGERRAPRAGRPRAPLRARRPQHGDGPPPRGPRLAACACPASAARAARKASSSTSSGRRPPSARGSRRPVDGPQTMPIASRGGELLNG